LKSGCAAAVVEENDYVGWLYINDEKMMIVLQAF
jgi:hypothetical protein